MTALRSAIYAGTVTHKRLVPRQHAFTYRVFALALDVDEIDLLDRDTRLFSRGRFNLLSFHDRDYAAGDGARVADYARRLVSTSGLAQFAARITLVSYPRVLGYAFNPLSVYFCSDRHGRLRAVLWEVDNTFGERHGYLIPVENGSDGLIAQNCAKGFYVSPFMPMALTYRFRFRMPGEALHLHITALDENGALLIATQRGERQALADGALLRLFLRFPLQAALVLGGIHWEALRLWRKGIALVARPGGRALAGSTGGGKKGTT